MTVAINANDYLYSSIPEMDNFEEYREACRQIEENNLRMFNENFEYEITFASPYEPIGKIRSVRGSKYSFKTIRGMELAFKRAMHEGYIELGVCFSYLTVMDLVKKAGGGSNSIFK